MALESATQYARGYFAVLFFGCAALLNSIDAAHATTCFLFLFLFLNLPAPDSLRVHLRSSVVDLLLVLVEGPSRRVSRVWALRDHGHDHELGMTLMHPLQVLFLHTLRMEQGVMSGATGPSARSVGLVKIIGSLTDIFRALGRLNTADIAAELLFIANVALFARALHTTIGMDTT